MIEYETGDVRTIFRKDYDGESLYEISNDVSESLMAEYNDIWESIPTDKHGFSLGTFLVTIEWYGETNE